MTLLDFFLELKKSCFKEATEADKRLIRDQLKEGFPSFYSKIYGAASGDTFIVLGNDGFCMRQQYKPAKASIKKNELFGATYKRRAV